MNNQGWIKLYRKLKETSFYNKPNILWLFVHLLLSANHQDKKILFAGEELIVKKGQLITGRKEIASQGALSEMQVRYGLKCLFLTNTITIKTTNKFSIITMCNYEDYQEINQQINQPVTNKQPTSNQPVTTNNNDKNVKNDKNDKNNTLAPKGADLNSLLSKFKQVNPFYERLYANKTQRSALERMVSKYGEQKMGNLIDHLSEIVSKPYAPQITTPYELETKMGKLIQFLKQDREKVNKFSVTKL